MCFLQVMCNKSILMIICNIYIKSTDHILGYSESILAHFLKLIIHVMCASLNKQLISCENCFGTLSGLSQGRGLREISSGPLSWRATGWAGLSGSMHIVGHPTAVAIISTRWGHSYANFCLNEVWRIHSRSALIVRCVKQTWLLVIQEKCVILSQKQPVACQWLRQHDWVLVNVNGVSAHV